MTARVHRFQTRAYRGTRNLRAVQTLLGHDLLAELDGDTAPSTIARKLGVGYKTVARIADTTKGHQPVGAG